MDTIIGSFISKRQSVKLKSYIAVCKFSPLSARPVAGHAWDTLHVHMCAMVVVVTMMMMSMVMVVMVMMDMRMQSTASAVARVASDLEGGREGRREREGGREGGREGDIEVKFSPHTHHTYLTSSQTTPALVHASTKTSMTHLHRGSVWHLKLLHMVHKHLRRLSCNLPWPRGGAILRAIDRLTCRRKGSVMRVLSPLR